MNHAQLTQWLASAERRAQQHDVDIKRLWGATGSRYQGDATGSISPSQAQHIASAPGAINDWPMYMAPPKWEVTIPAVNFLWYPNGAGNPPALTYQLQQGTYLIDRVPLGIPLIGDLGTAYYQNHAVWSKTISQGSETYYIEMWLWTDSFFVGLDEYGESVFEQGPNAYLGAGIVSPVSYDSGEDGVLTWLQNTYTNADLYNRMTRPPITGVDFDGPSTTREYVYHSRAMVTFPIAGLNAYAVPIYE